MLIQLSPSDDRPIYSQIGDQVKFAVAAGLVGPGDLVPFGPRAVEAARGEPEHGGAGVPRASGAGGPGAGPGDGLAGGRGGPGALRRDDRREFVRRSGSASALDEARRSNLAPEEIESILREEWARSNGRPRMPRSRDEGGAGGEGGRSMSQSCAIRVEGLTKRYGARAAVDRLTLEVPTGSVFGLLGENGAGKSTTIKAILGLIAPDGGRVETLGLDPSRTGPGGPPAGRLRARAGRASTTG